MIDVTSVNDSCGFRYKSGSRGFTLIEVLLALVVTIMVLAACGMLYFTLAQAWLGHKEGDVELQHEHSIFGYLENQITIAPKAPSENIPHWVDLSVSWRQLPGSTTYDPYYLSWMEQAPPVFCRSGQWLDLLSVRVYLKYENRNGISIVWHPEDERISRMDFDDFDVEDFVYEMPLEKDVQQLQYAYYDVEDDSWEIEDHTRNYDPKDNGVPEVVIFEIGEDDPYWKKLYVGKGK